MRYKLIALAAAAALLGSRAAFASGADDFDAQAASVRTQTAHVHQRMSECAQARSLEQDSKSYMDSTREGLRQLGAMPVIAAPLTILLIPGDPAFDGENASRPELLKFLAARKKYWTARKQELLRWNAVLVPEWQAPLRAAEDAVDRVIADNEQDKAYVEASGHSSKDEQALIDRKAAMLKSILPDLTTVLEFDKTILVPDACGR